MSYTPSEELKARHDAYKIWSERFKDQEYTPEQAFVLGASSGILVGLSIAKERNHLRSKLNLATILCFVYLCCLLVDFAKCHT